MEILQYGSQSLKKIKLSLILECLGFGVISHFNLFLTLK